MKTEGLRVQYLMRQNEANIKVIDTFPHIKIFENGLISMRQMINLCHNKYNQSPSVELLSSTPKLRIQISHKGFDGDMFNLTF